MERIGLIAGNGKLPLLFAQEAKKRGVEVIAVAVREETEKNLENLVDKIFWVRVGELKKLIDTFKNENIKKAVMIGQIKHGHIFRNLFMDHEMMKLLFTVKDRKTDSLLSAVCNRLKDFGIELIDSSTYLMDLMPEEGVLTKRKPTDEEWQDIEFGKGVAGGIAGLDIGQTVVVKKRVVLAIEAIEGTDEAICRGSILGKGKVVVVKISKPNQDNRFDIPVVGPGTIKTMVENKVSVLAIEAKKTLFIDMQDVISQADRCAISIVAI